jgi:hypothetical protein
MGPSMSVCRYFATMELEVPLLEPAVAQNLDLIAPIFAQKSPGITLVQE